MLPFLENKKQEIEAKIGVSLDWNPNPENRDKIIFLSHKTDFSNESSINEALAWLIDYIRKFREVFRNII